MRLAGKKNLWQSIPSIFFFFFHGNVEHLLQKESFMYDIYFFSLRACTSAPILGTFSFVVSFKLGLSILKLLRSK